MKQKRRKKESVLRIYERGYDQTDPKKIEKYCGILNDLVEDIHTSKINPTNLIEIIGYLRREYWRGIERLHDMHSQIVNAFIESNRICYPEVFKTDSKIPTNILENQSENSSSTASNP